jgi:dihydrofolate reductase
MLAEDGVATVTELRSGSGKDIWLSGGGELFRNLLAADLVDTVEVGVSPILLGQGRPFLPSLGRAQKLKLTYEHPFPSGLLVLYYDVVR